MPVDGIASPSVQREGRELELHQWPEEGLELCSECVLFV